MKARFQDLQCGFDDEFHADRRGEVKNKFRLRRELGQFRVGGNLGLDETEIFVLRHRAQIVPAAGGKIVNDDHAFPVL